MTIYQILEPNIVPKFVIWHKSRFIPACKQSRNQVLVGKIKCQLVLFEEHEDRSISKCVNGRHRK